MKITSDTEVLGEVLVEVLLEESRSGDSSLTVTVHAGRGLSATNVYAILSLGDEKDSAAPRQQTAMAKGSRFPVFGETFTFRQASFGAELCVTLREGGGFGGGSFAGSARVALSVLAPSVPSKGWFRLHPRAKDVVAGCGSVRLRMSLTRHLIMPPTVYKPLASSLLSSC